jgi:hypothetical protein
MRFFRYQIPLSRQVEHPNRPDHHQSMKRLLLTLCLTTALHAQQTATEPQSWTASDGRVMQAKFIKLDGESVVIEKDGTQFAVAFAKLAEASVAQAKRLGGALSAQARLQEPIIIKVMVLNFDPMIPQEGNKKLHEVCRWNDPRKLAEGYVKDVHEASSGFIKYEIVHWEEIAAFHTKVDGFTYTPAQYMAAHKSGLGWHKPDTADYPKTFEDFKVLPKIDSGEVDEVWFFGGPYFGYNESAMAGPGAFYINGAVYDSVKSTRPFAIMGFNYERGGAEMLHDLCHRTESTMTRIYGGWKAEVLDSNWAKFAANEIQSKTAAAGTCHYPPNAEKDYDYENKRKVASDADDWLNYPELTGKKTMISCEAWGGPDYHRNYMKWWFKHLPVAPGINQDGRLNNWWRYVFEFNNYEGGTGLPRGEDAVGCVAAILAAGGTDQEFTVRYYDQTGINVATLDGSDVEVQGPAGFTQIATLGRVGPEVSTTAGTARAVTYHITPPGGSWDMSDLGNYRILMRPNQVSDTLGNDVPAGEVGGFPVAIDDPALIKVAQMLANGQATAQHTKFDIGEIPLLFDGNVDSLVRTPNIDPMVVTLTFTQAQAIHTMRAYFCASSYRWQVETADNLADLDKQTGSWQQAVPLTEVASDSYSTMTLAKPVTAKLVRLTATRLTGDDCVHANEWQLIGPPLSGTTQPSTKGKP